MRRTSASARNTDGAVSEVYPTLARAPADGFGLCVVGTNGAVHAAGDWDVPFTIMSVSKPFVFALVCDVDRARGGAGADRRQRDRPALQRARRDRARRAWPHQSDGQSRRHRRRRALFRARRSTNAGRSSLDGLSRFAGRALELDEEVLACALASNARNRAIAQLLQSYGRIDGDPARRSNSIRGNARST